MAFLRWVIGFVLTIAIAGFAALNRHDITVFWNPVEAPYELPLYLIALGFMGTGFVFGGILVWLNGSKTRRAKRQQKKHIKNLEKELKTVRENAPVTTVQPQTVSTLLPTAKEKKVSSL